MSFGVLCRSLNGNPNRSSIRWIDERWKLIKQFIKATGEIDADVMSSGGESKPNVIHSKSDEVNMTITFMKEVFQQLSNNRYTIYHLDHMKKRDDALAHLLKPVGYRRRRNMTVFQNLRKQIPRFHSQIVNANILKDPECKRWFAECGRDDRAFESPLDDVVNGGELKTDGSDNDD